MTIYHENNNLYFVYILQSESTRKFYIGQTDNLEERLNRHNTGQTVYTKNKGPWKIVYFKEFSTRSEAVNEETRLKKMKSRKYIDNLIKYHG